MSIRQEQFEEARERARELALYEQAQRELREGKINCSERFGALFWLSEEDLARVKVFEERYGALVYHVIRTPTECGELLSYLYVSSCPEEWPMEREDLLSGSPLVYVENLDAPDLSEFGYIGIRPMNGGVIRTA